jgi:hypothetical protein
MKRVLLLVALLGFAVGAQAGDPNVSGMGCCKGEPASAQASCCAKGKGAQAKAAQGRKAGPQDSVARKSLQSPKALSLACR